LTQSWSAFFFPRKGPPALHLLVKYWAIMYFLLIPGSPSMFAFSRLFFPPVTRIPASAMSLYAHGGNGLLPLSIFPLDKVFFFFFSSFFGACLCAALHFTNSCFPLVFFFCWAAFFDIFLLGSPFPDAIFCFFFLSLLRAIRDLPFLLHLGSFFFPSIKGDSSCL